jgi:hypothetical protein
VYNSDVFGTFGNTNFQSAFMGMVAVTGTVWAIFGRLRWPSIVALFGLTILSLANVFLSSEQGYFNYLAGVLSAICLFLFMTKRKELGIAFAAFSLFGAFLVGLGMINSGPLANLIFKSSVEARSFYWQAAFKMMIENPLFGVGLDGYGDWYRRSRSQQSNGGFVADTAHSIHLDLGSSGGFPMLIAYLLFVSLALVSIVKVVRRGQNFDVIFALLVSVWVAYQAQSVISINQLGLGVWGWSLTGLLIGYEINTRSDTFNKITTQGKPSRALNRKSPSLAILFGIGGIVIGMIVSLPPYMVATKYYGALQVGNAGAIVDATYLKPYDRTRFSYTAQILIENKLEAEAIRVLSDATEIYPDNIAFWSLWSQIPSASEQQKLIAKGELRRLDPFNQSLG